MNFFTIAHWNSIDNKSSLLAAGFGAGEACLAGACAGAEAGAGPPNRLIKSSLGALCYYGAGEAAATAGLLAGFACTTEELLTRDLGYTVADNRGRMFYINGRKENMGEDELYDFLSGWTCFKYNNTPHDKAILGDESENDYEADAIAERITQRGMIALREIL